MATIRRFYRDAGVAEAAGGYAITLDGKRVRTPVGAALAVPRRAMAEAIAAEWQAQGETVRPETMPLTQLASTAIDRVAVHRDDMIDQLMNYAGTDLLCYRAAQADLCVRQARTWQPLLDWAALHLDAPLMVTTGILPVEQPESTLRALRHAVDAYDDLRLAAVQAAAAALGSLVLALALEKKRIDGDEAFAASQIDETYQIELWGEDAEAAKRRRALAADVAGAARFLELCA